MDQDIASSDQKAYRVLARKYRPTNFEEMIGHEALIKTLTNAIESGRIAQAFMLTGVRGVGKTTTARIIAKALNCIGPDGNGGPTISPCGVCDNCRAITEDRHVDVQELDAASRTGVADIRELIDGVRYRPVSARFKVYILDEVHMLSNNAFNALLKTLEEPPEHVKFIFATTEIRKVPVTVLSRCQRFDLRRVVVDELIGHFRKICDLEDVTIEDEAVAMIARAADGSVRDGLSILDQAISLSAGAVQSELVRGMLGLADRGRIFDLMDHVMKGDAVASLEAVRGLYDDGADPAVILQDLMDVTFFLTRMKLVPNLLEDPNIPEIEKTKGLEIGGKLGVAQLSRVWQVLMKGLGETQNAPNAIQACEMVIIRLLHVSDLPTPADLVAKLQGQATAASPSHTNGPMPGGSTGGPPGNFSKTDASMQAARAALASDGSNNPPATSPDNAVSLPSEPKSDLVPNPKNFQALVALFKEKRQMIQYDILMRHCRLVEFTPGHVKLQLERGAPKDGLNEIARALKEWTGNFWRLEHVEQQGAQTLMQKEENRKKANRDEAEEVFLVQQILKKFPESRVVYAEKRGGNEVIEEEDIEVSATVDSYE